MYSSYRHNVSIIIIAHAVRAINVQQNTDRLKYNSMSIAYQPVFQTGRTKDEDELPRYHRGERQHVDIIVLLKLLLLLSTHHLNLLELYDILNF